MADRHAEDIEGELNVLENSDCDAELSHDMSGKNKANSDIWQVITSATANYWKMVVLAALLLVSHRYAIQLWINTWGSPNSYYSHGPLVPAIAAFMLWANRKRIAAARIRPSWTGLALMIVGIPLFIFGHWSTRGRCWERHSSCF